MTDYIDWVLGLVEEEEDSELVELGSGASLISGRSSDLQIGADRVVGDHGGDEGRPTPIVLDKPWEAGPSKASRLPTAEVARRRPYGVDFLTWGRWDGQTDTGRPPKGKLGAAELLPSGERQTQPTLYDGLSAQSRQVRWVSRGPRQAVAEHPLGMGAAPSRGLTPTELDRLFQRDARRYDGGWQEAVW